MGGGLEWKKEKNTNKMQKYQSLGFHEFGVKNMSRNTLPNSVLLTEIPEFLEAIHKSKQIPEAFKNTFMVKLSLLYMKVFSFVIKLQSFVVVVVDLFLHDSIEQLKTLKKKFGKCSKGFESEMKGKDLVSNTLKNIRDKGIDFFQSI